MKLDGDLLTDFGQGITKLAQALLQVGEGFAAKAIDSQQSVVAQGELLHDLTGGGDTGFSQGIRRACAELEFGNRAGG